jgi:hypothetical protein
VADGGGLEICRKAISEAKSVFSIISDSCVDVHYVRLSLKKFSSKFVAKSDFVLYVNRTLDS